MTKYNYKITNKNFNEDKPLRVAVYTRVSTTDQYVNWVWIDSQKKDIEYLIKGNKDKYTYSKNKHYYEDWGKSWADEHRPALDKMIRDIENWEIDIVIVYKIDRLFRKLLYLLQFIDNISKKWVFLKSVKDNIDTTDGMWMVMLQFMWIIWDIERDNIRIRTIDWKKTKASQWYYVWWWKTPFWYDLHDTPWWKKLIVNSDEAKIVNRIFDMYVNQKYTLWDISRTLTMEWIPTRDDRLIEDVYKENINKDKHKEKYKNEYWNIDDKNLLHKKWSKKVNDWKWYSSSIRKILKREIYTWKYYYGMTTKEWDEDKNIFHIVEKPKESWIEFDSPVILKDTSLFYDAKKLLSQNKVMKRKSPYLFSWLVTCWLCWYKYNWYKSSKGTFNYRCKWWMSWSNLKVRCRNAQISEAILYKYCWLELERNLSNPDNFKAIVFNEKKNKEIVSTLNKRISEIQKLLKFKRNTLENAIISELEATNEMKKNVYKMKIIDYEKEISKLEIEDKEKRREISIIKSNEKKRNDIKNFNEIHQNAVKNLDDEKKKDLIKKYIKIVTINPWKIIIRFNILDELEGKDWRDGEDWESKKLKWKNDFFNKYLINMRDWNYKLSSRKNYSRVIDKQDL